MHQQMQIEGACVVAADESGERPGFRIAVVLLDEDATDWDRVPA